MEPPIESQQQITLPLPEFLSILFGTYKENAYPTAIVINAILAVPNYEQYVHIQKPGDCPGEIDCKIPCVWKLSAWRSSYERWTLLKKQSEVDRSLSSLAKDLKLELVNAITLQFGLDESMAVIMANKMIGANNIAGARRLGIDITELVKGIKENTGKV